jgi:hypothetical protein
MGYAATTIVMYGVAIDEDIAEQIKNNEMHEDDGFNDEKMYDNIFYRKNHEGNRYPQNEPITQYSEHDKGMGEVFYPEMRSDGTDSRIASNTYEPGYQHYLGIYIASKGYAYDDRINQFVKKVPQEAVENFKNAIQPLLDKYGVTDEPDIQIINQTW